MRAIKRIVVHMSYTPPSMDVGVPEIRDWHVNGNGWRDIGYHYVIRRNGTIEHGRPVEQAGAHVAGHNADSIGICLVGGKREDRDSADCNYTLDQWEALRELLDKLAETYQDTELCGHRDLANRECPGFDAKVLK